MNTRCIIKFLSEDTQRRLRRVAQTQGDSFEYTLEAYKKLFITNYKFCMSNRFDCESCKECQYNISCLQVVDELKKIEVDEIENFFLGLENAYKCWINSDLAKGISGLESLMKDKNLFEFKLDGVENDIYFKGRCDKDILTTWDMFHIPFNKRYLIKNQRYSITGQPLIYLGLSILDVVEELEVENEKIGILKTSSYRLPNNLKIYDSINNIYDFIIDTNLNNMFEETMNLLQKTSRGYIEVLFRNIVSSVCSFEKRKEHKSFHFCEEYVIPQMLAQVLKKNKFDGIRYCSTKKFNNVNFKLNEEEKKLKGLYKDDLSCSKNILYKENMALFTNIKYEESNVYDKELYNKITITRPIDLERLENISINDLEYLIEEVEFLNNNNNKKLFNEANLLFQKFKREFDSMYIDEVKYLDMEIGKIHLNHINIIMSSILQKCMESDKNE